MFSNRAARLIVPIAMLAFVFTFPGHLHGQFATQAQISTVAGIGIPSPCDPSINICGSFSGDGGPAIGASLALPQGVAVDAAGNIYIGDSLNCRIRRVDATTGIITTVAGGNGGDSNATTICNYNGDNIPAISATLSFGVSEVAVDASGNFYINDFTRVRKVDITTGLISTVAGTGVEGYNGDNIPATSAMLNGFGGLALDGSGNLYIADGANQRIRRVDAATGTITTVAGNGYIGPDGYGGFSGDGGPATSAELNEPLGVAVDGVGNLYISDDRNYRIRFVNAATGIITTVAGNGNQGYNGDGIAATTAEINNGNGITVDSLGNIYFADLDRVRCVDAATGLISTVAGVGVPGYNGDNIAATSAQLNAPFEIALDSNGYLYIADSFNQDIRKITPPAIVVTPTSVNFGSISVGYTSAAQSLTFTFNAATQIGNISVLTTGATGKDFQSAAGTTCTVTTYSVGSSCILNLLFSPTLPGIRSGAVILYDPSNPPNTIGLIPLRGTGVGPVIALEPGVITAAAGTGVSGYSGDNGLATSAELAVPLGVAIDDAGNLYIADQDNSRVRRVDAITGNIATVAGGGAGCTQQTDTFGDGCAATDSLLNAPCSVAIGRAGDIYISECGGNRVRRVDAATDKISTFAGGGTGCSSQTDTAGDNCSATSAVLAFPAGIKLDSYGNLYIADSGNVRIRRVDGLTGFITSVAGNGIQGFAGDGGLATNAEISPLDVAVDALGNVYLSNNASNDARVRKVDAVTGVITTFAGTGAPGYSGDNGLASLAQISQPWGLAIDGAGDLYIADPSNFNVRKVDAATNIIRTIVGVGGGCAAETDSFGDNCAATLVTKLGPYGIAVDAAGKLYVADGSDNLVRAISTTTPPLTFPDTNVGSTSATQSITVANIGNTPLTFSNLTPSQNFGIDAGTTTCSTSSPVASGDSCQLGIVFAPTISGPLTGNVTLVDDSMNLSGNSQQVQLSGNGQGSSSTTTTLTSAPNPSVFGQGVTVTANITSIVSGGPTPTGAITLNDSGVALASVPLVNGMATFITTALSAGIHSITASYSGDANHQGSTSGAISQVVNSAATTTAVASNAEPAVIGQSVTYTAVVSNAYGAPLLGSVTLKDGIKTLGTFTVSAGQVSYTTSYTADGTHKITAAYSGDANDQGSTGSWTQYIETLPVASTTKVATSGSPSTVGQSVTFTATVASTYGSIPNGDTVTFYDGTTQIGTGTTAGGVATFSTSALSVKTHTIKATYAGDATFKSSSGATSQVVEADATATSLSGNPIPSNFGQTTILTAVVTTTGSTTPTGKVTFYDGGSSLGTGTLDTTGTATLATAKLAVGTSSLTATYAGDSLNAKSTSASLPQTVNQAQLTVTVGSTPNPSVAGKSVRFTATLSSNGSLPNGQTVTFSYNGGTLGTATIIGGKAVYSTSTLPLGSDQVTATYGGTSDFSPASGAVAQTVN